MAKNGPGRNGTPPKTGKTGPKEGGFWSLQAKGSRYARHLARIFDQRPPRGSYSVTEYDTNSEAAFPDSVFGPYCPLVGLPIKPVWLAKLAI